MSKKIIFSAKLKFLTGYQMLNNQKNDNYSILIKNSITCCKKDVGQRLNTENIGNKLF